MSAGHGFGLSASLFGYAFVGILLAFLVSTIALMILLPRDLETDYLVVAHLSVRVTTVTSLAAGALVLFWSTTIPALLVRESAELEDPLDPTTFD